MTTRIILPLLLAAFPLRVIAQGSGIATDLPAPVSVYCNWASYDELSDTVLLSEALALRELDEILRLRQQGVRFDYYLMDAFWFAPDGAYRAWKKPAWPQGPDRWLEACKANNLIPGLWFATNRHIRKGLLTAAPEWANSLATNNESYCLFEGDFLAHLMESFQMYADKGVRLFKLDFANFGAATEEGRKKYTREQIIEKNQQAFKQAIRDFRAKNPDVIIIAYNGFGGYINNTITPFPATADLRWRWLETFETLYSGDPRLSDVPMTNFWRSKDLYSDHMVRQYLYNAIPLSRIDNFAALLGNTGTCYYRGNTAWKGTVLLSYARGGWFNGYNGALELIDNEGGAWLARVQQIYMPLQQFGHTTVWGDIPGAAEPYGYLSRDAAGALFTIVNPGHVAREIDLPVDGDGRVLFHDAGFNPRVREGKLLLGSEQLVVVGFGKYASSLHDLGVETDVIIPAESELLPVDIKQLDPHSAVARLTPPRDRCLRVFFTQRDENGNPRRSYGGTPPEGVTMDNYLTLSAKQGRKSIPVKIDYNRVLWSGLSWAAGVIDAGDIDPRRPVEITCTAKDGDSRFFKIEVYAARYDQ